MNVYIFFSHILLKEQEKELINNFFCEKIIYLPEKLQFLWSNIEEENDYSQLFFDFLEKNAQKKDYILIQGEWGITYKMINFCKIKGLVPIYSFSKRTSHEEVREGVVIKTSYFKHIKFKRY